MRIAVGRPWRAPADAIRTRWGKPAGPLRDPAVPTTIGGCEQPMGRAMRRLYGPDVIEAWERARRANVPSIPTDEDVTRMPEIAAVTAAVMNVGIGLRMRAITGEEIDVMLNPVVARAIAAGILKHGQEEGWLDERGEVISPPLPLDH